MKTRIYCVSLVFAISATTLSAKDLMWSENGTPTNDSRYEAYPSEGMLTESEKDLKIISLYKMLEQQQKMYVDKIAYLEDELEKSKDRLVEKSINHDKAQDFLEKRFTEETTYLKKELVAKTKTMMEFQRQVEKIKPSEDMRNLIKVNTELALELRKSEDNAAFSKLKGENFAKSLERQPTGGRQPASVEK